MTIRTFYTDKQKRRRPISPSHGVTSPKKYKPPSEPMNELKREVALEQSGSYDPEQRVRDLALQPSLQDLNVNEAALLRQISREYDFRPVKMSEYRSKRDRESIKKLDRMGFLRVMPNGELKPSFVHLPAEQPRENA
ncbi:MAG: hypothetical protein M1368_12865 [Thaumarchaeota archaeon]|nr:hypothetical protein [Nitrososphaerota archaeon]